MINVDFSIAVAVYTAFFLAGVLIMWLVSRKQRYKDLTLNPKFIWFCHICTHTYINTKEDTISICPRCGSYNKKELT